MNRHQETATIIQLHDRSDQKAALQALTDYEVTLADLSARGGVIADRVAKIRQTVRNKGTEFSDMFGGTDPYAAVEATISELEQQADTMQPIQTASAATHIARTATITALENLHPTSSLEPQATDATGTVTSIEEYRIRRAQSLRR